ncbi:MAG: DUF3592 domain-containing protein [Acidobacteria bacterium]|nr:DUF3592 domain-containing protein [Acidobacteriota bacterium]
MLMTAKPGGNFLPLFGLAWLLAAVPFGLAGRYMLRLEGRFEKEGVSVAGEVVDKRVEENRSYDRDTRRTTRSESYWVHFKFKTPDGQSRESKDTVDSDIWASLNAGSPVEVHYLESNPQTSRIARPASFVDGYAFFAFSAAALLIGAISLFYFFGGKKETNRLLQYGVSTEGTVTSVGPGLVMVNQVPQWQISYTYRAVKGREFKGTTRHMPPDRAMVWVVGDKGTVKYDPRKPQKGLWVGRA